METDGLINGYLNKGIGNMVSQGQIKHSEGKERKNLRLADINGDGRDDLLYVNMIDGAVTEWQNGGQILSSGSAFQWNWKGNISTGGLSRGACVEYGSLYGLGRAGYIVVEPATNKAWTWFNVCPDGLGAVAPNLPSGAPPVPAAGSKLPTGVSLTRATAVVSGTTTIFTDTLVPTTTTDSRGVTVIGTITKGPQPTTPFPVTSLTTYTSFPPSVTWRSTSVSSDTHDASSSPVLAPWPFCYFCPPGSNGIVLSGLPPGVYPPGGPPAGLPTPFPRLTIHPGDSDDRRNCNIDSSSDRLQAPAVTATSAYPTHTPGSYTGGAQGYAECYDSSSGDTTEFSYDDYMSVVSHLCVSGRSLLPPNGYVRQIGNGNGYDLYADVSWAPDQTGCPTKAARAIADTTAHQEDCIDDCSLLSSMEGGLYHVPRSALSGRSDTNFFTVLPNFYCTYLTTFDGANSYGGVWVLKVPNVGCVLMNLYSLHADQSSQQNKRDSASNATLAAPFLGSSNDTMTFRHNLTTVMNFTLGGEFPGRFSAITGHFTSDAVDYVPPFGTPAYGPGNASLADAYGYGASNMSLSPASYGNVTEESL
ncbi:hypothetical protein LTR27_010380 [Elasticomyces elasticus]|nr:hypothetical protein LTR27_010380 [Elasticomyces elasticus]